MCESYLMKYFPNKAMQQHNKKSLLYSRINIYLILSTLLFLARVIIFASSHGGIETDDGWRLAVAKNLAHRGIYATYTNPITEEGVGVHISAHGRPAVQDESGLCYFPTAWSPGYVFPQALMIRIFGNGWWQYRLWPLITYAGLLILSFHTVYTVGGLFALLAFQIWLWATPQLTITFAYTSYSEHIALLYTLISFLFYSKGSFENRKIWYMVLAGFFLGCAIVTKLIYVLVALAYAPVLIWEMYLYRKEARERYLGWIGFAFASILPLFFFECYRYISLVPRFGLDGWKATIEDLWLKFMHDGSGIPTVGRFHWTLISEKLRCWIYAGFGTVWLAWFGYFISPFSLSRRVCMSHKIVFYLMYASAALAFLWYIAFSPFPFTRRVWQGLILGMMLICIGLGIIMRDRLSSLTKENITIICIILIIIGVAVNYEKVELKPFLDSATINNWRIARRNGKGMPHGSINSMKDQKDTLRFFAETMSEKDRVFFANWYIVAEMSALADKVFYPLTRYFKNNGQNPDGGGSFLILGPYQHGAWSMTGREYVENAVRLLCNEVVFSNESYILCDLKEPITDE